MKRALLIAALVATPVFAADQKGFKEPGIGTLIGGHQSSGATGSTGAGFADDKTSLQPEAASLEVSRRTAACVARSDSARAARFVATSLDVPASTAFGPISPVMQRCLGTKVSSTTSEMQLSRRALKALLAEALLLQAPPRNLAPTPLAEARMPADLAQESPNQRIVDELATCLAYTQPQPSEALIRSSFTSPEEKAAFQALTPTLPGCLGSNVTLTANKAGLRMATALAFYRRANDVGQEAKK